MGKNGKRIQEKTGKEFPVVITLSIWEMGGINVYYIVIWKMGSTRVSLIAKRFLSVMSAIDP